MFAGQAFARRASLAFIGTCSGPRGSWASGARAYEPPSTPTYVISRQIEVAAVGVNLASGLADLEALSPRVATECPHALVGAPTGTQRQGLETEMAFDVALTLDATRCRNPSMDSPKRRDSTCTGDPNDSTS